MTKVCSFFCQICLFPLVQCRPTRWDFDMCQIRALQSTFRLPRTFQSKRMHLDLHLKIFWKLI
jgi:hypothetical protein